VEKLKSQKTAFAKLHK